METWIAFVTASAALLGSLISYVKLRSDLKDARDRWAREHRTQLRADFLRPVVDERMRLYPPVFKLLGSVRDTDPSGEHHRDLEQNPSQLTRVADELLGHVYGDAGLVMSMDTRNVLLAVLTQCRRFQENDGSVDTTVRGFYLARRVLRADLQLEDVEDVESELKRLVEEFTKTG